MLQFPRPLGVRMAEIFLSYSSKDAQAAERIRDALSAAGYEVFWDQATPPGQDWDSWIRSKLQGSKLAVVLWSKTSVESPNVRHEAMIALGHKKIIPVMIDALTPEDFPMGLYVVQAVNLTQWRDTDAVGYARLVAEVKARIGAGAAPVRPGKAQTGSKPNLFVRFGAPVVAVAVIGAATWGVLHDQKDKPAGMVVDTRGNPVVVPSSGVTECPGGAPPVLGVCPIGSPPTPDKTGAFSKLLVGHWRWSGDQPCAQGPNVTLENGRLVFSTPDTRFVHQIEADDGQRTTTRVLEPDFALGEQYVLTPEYVATSDVRNFNLVVENKTAGSRDTWSPCEP